MAQTEGYRNYLNECYEISVFDAAARSKTPWIYHLHGKEIVTARLLEDLKYDIKLDVMGAGETLMQKTSVKFLYPEDVADPVQKLIKKTDKNLVKRNLGPIVPRRDRNFIKNKTLYHLMMEKEVVFFSLLEGEIIRGIVKGFSRYDISVGMKGGVPLTFLRHSLFDARSKNGRCLLKSFQKSSKDWKRSPWFKN